MTVRLLLLFAILLLPLSAPAETRSTESVFEQIRDRVVVVEILDRQSGSKSSLGSGFVVDTAGRVATNYHVISALVLHPDRYTARLRYVDGRLHETQVLNLDIVHDLALLQGRSPAPGYLPLAGAAPVQGERLLALGSPLDLGFTIVEGTYNGLVQHALYEKIHFTGSINSGMSGGPTVNTRGEVVGINVATAGNGVGFVVPVAFLAQLLREPGIRGGTRKDYFARMQDQLLRQQAGISAAILAGPRQTVRLGGYELPGQLAGFLRCWGDTYAPQEAHLRIVSYDCRPESDIFITDSWSTGTVQYHHEWLEGKSIAAPHFQRLFDRRFPGEALDDVRTDELVGAYRCQPRFLEHRGVRMRTLLCMRRYRLMPRLYDMTLFTATLNQSQSGAISRLRLDGFSREALLRLSRHFLESYAWRTR